MTPSKSYHLPITINCHILDATVEDVEAIVDVLIASKSEPFAGPLSEHDGNVAFWMERRRHYLTEGSRTRMALGDRFVLLAEVERVSIGFATYHHIRRHGADAELQSIYLFKRVQRLGIGSKLLREIAVRLVADGSRSLCVGYDLVNPYYRFCGKHGAVEIDPHWAIWQDVTSVVIGSGH